MNIHYLQHVPLEGLGSIEEWIRRGGHAVRHLPRGAVGRRCAWRKGLRQRRQGDRLVSGRKDGGRLWRRSVGSLPTANRCVPLAWRHLRHSDRRGACRSQRRLREPGLRLRRAGGRLAVSPGNNPGHRKQLIAHGANELVQGRYIQTPQQMLADASRFNSINRVMHDLLDRLATDSPERIAPAGGETR